MMTRMILKCQHPKLLESSYYKIAGNRGGGATRAIHLEILLGKRSFHKSIRQQRTPL